MGNADSQGKPKVALYWAASCGGCECTIVDIGEPLLDIASKVEFVLWPVALDFKYHHIRAMEDKNIDLCLFNGAIRNSEQEEMAKLLRQKSKIVVAYGACAHMGGIPGLSNFSTKEATFNTIYNEVPTVKDEKKRPLPQTKTKVKEGELELPEFYDRVYKLNDIIDVDYYVPGCPPTSDQTVLFLTAVLEGNLPPHGAVFGPKKNLCDECPRERKEKIVKEFYRPHEKRPNLDECLLDQGFFCQGPVTRAGCGSQCINANMPCRGCYGPSDKVSDMGGAFISTLASIIDSQDEKEIRDIVAKIPDIAGTVHRFSLPSFIVNEKSKKEDRK
ncbi:MAG: oxidoreductase [Candidatus Omnitrophica bacterium]|nr:oxidoreductase [Candidatus Omnitrophota bacterium]